MSILFPFLPNWRDSYKITYEFKTDILVSRSGKEQRRALRFTPRKTIEYTTTTAFSNLLAFERMLSKNQAVDLVVPEIPFAATSTSEMGPSGTTIGVDFFPVWATNGSSAVLVYRKQTTLVTISTHSGLNITFTGSTGLDWPVGTRVCKALSGMLATNLTGSALTNAATETGISFAVDPITEAVDEGTPGTALNGYEIFPFPPNWSTAISVNYQHPTDVLDYGFGPITTYVPVAFGTTIRQPTFLRKNRADAVLLQQFFARMKGQQGEFYFPSGQADLVLASTAHAGDGTLTIVGTDDSDYYSGDTVHQAIIIDMPDGVTRYPFKISALNTSGGNTVVTLVGTVPVDLGPNAGIRISWMPRARFATDAMTLEFLTDAVAQTKLSIQTLEDLA